jgi:hypothetical protein
MPWLKVRLLCHAPPLSNFLTGFHVALIALRNQLTIKFGEPPIAPQDERLVLAQQWLETVPGAHDIFGIWESANQVLQHRPPFMK